MTEPWQEVDLAKLYDEYLKVNVDLAKYEIKNKILAEDAKALAGALDEMGKKYKSSVEALELMTVENQGLKDTLSEALGMLRDGLRTYEDEQYASVLEGFVRDAVSILEEIE